MQSHNLGLLFVIPAIGYSAYDEMLDGDAGIRRMTEVKVLLNRNMNIPKRQQLLKQKKVVLKRSYGKDQSMQAYQGLDTTREGAWDWNLKTDQFMLSDNWAQYIGSENSAGKDQCAQLWQRIEPEDRQRVERVRSLYLEGEIPEFHVVFRMMADDNKHRWILSRGKIVEWDDSGAPLRMAGTHQDITRQKKAEKALKYQKSVLESFFQYSPDAMVHLDHQQRILKINEQFTRLFGYTQEECLHQRVDDLITNASLLKEAREITRRTEDNQFVEVETVRVRKNGSKVPVVIRGGPVRVDDRIVGYQGIYTDITLRKQEEKELVVAKHRAEAASQVKSRFLSNMSHEIRTPMNGIYGAAVLLENTQLSEEQQELVNMLLESADRMSETVSNLLDVSRIESGRMELKEEVFRLDLLMEEVMEPFHILSNTRSLAFSLKTEQATQAWVLGDRGKLARTLYHLLSNAFKFTKTGGIQVHAQLKRYEEPVAVYRFSISDTGIGIAQEDLSKLFHSFTQVDDSITKPYQGAGLGLVIVQKLVELMGGTVSAESTLGQGSLFSFEIPLRVTAFKHRHAEEETQKPAARSGRQIRLLAVEKDSINRELLQKVGEKLGVQVDVVENGFIAIRQFATVLYDLVLMDVDLPTINGMEVTAVIRSFEKNFGDHTPIVGLSSRVLNRDRESCLAAGMDDYLTKPLDVEKLSQVLRKWIR